jgi:lysozyme family protein
MADYHFLKPFILSWEGGFAILKGDRGGATNKGVTIATFRSFFGKNKTVEDLKNITDAQWDTIFLQGFWNKWLADQIEDQSIANLLVDWVYNSGKWGIIHPQRVLGVKDDGIVGPRTIGAINGYPDQKELFEKLWKSRQDYYKRIAKGEQARFLNGWLRRLNCIRYGYLVLNNKAADKIYF